MVYDLGFSPNRDPSLPDNGAAVPTTRLVFQRTDGSEIKISDRDVPIQFELPVGKAALEAAKSAPNQEPVCQYWDTEARGGSAAASYLPI